MRCPRCDTAVLAERDRDGIVVDVCSSCRGIWLDRGELEKLIARATRELDEVAALPPPRSVRYEHPAEPRRYPEYGHADYRHHPKRKRSWLETLGDVFD